MLLTEVQLILGQNTDWLKASGGEPKLAVDHTLPHHQLCEDDVQLLRGGHGRNGLQGHHVGWVIMAVGDLWLVVSFEATREKRRQASSLMLLYPCNHGDLLLKHGQKQQKQLGNFAEIVTVRPSSLKRALLSHPTESITAACRT